MRATLLISVAVTVIAAPTTAFSSSSMTGLGRQEHRRFLSDSGSSFTRLHFPLFHTKLDKHDVRNQRDLFLLSLDGTLLSSTRYKSLVAMEAAFKVWPSLIATARTLNLDPYVLQDESWNWLVEKLNALSPVTHQGDKLDKMLGSDTVFLVRVLLEEQVLDGGRSNGRGGKYGGKYHPGWTSDFDSDGSMVGTRPLTVGELYANWGELREVMDFKYPIIDIATNRKMDPMPRIREVLNELLFDEAIMPEQKYLPIAYDAIFENQSLNHCEIRKNSIILLGHEAQLPSALTSFASMGISFKVNTDLDWNTSYFDKWLKAQNYGDGDIVVTITSSDKVLNYCGSITHSSSLLLVIPNTNNKETQSEVIKRIMLSLGSRNDEESNADDTDETNISVVHSSLDVLKECKLLLENEPPWLHHGALTCFLQGSSSTSVNLLLPEWADNIDPTSITESEMDPWLNVVTETQFMESITAKFVSTS